jgi:hypothetical protein
MQDRTNFSRGISHSRVNSFCSHPASLWCFVEESIRSPYETGKITRFAVGIDEILVTIVWHEVLLCRVDLCGNTDVHFPFESTNSENPWNAELRFLCNSWKHN